jgi:methyl-accepting chemotaxis protein
MGSMVTLLNNTRISRKLFIAPAMITGFMIGMAVVSQYGSHQQSGALDEVVNVAFVKDGLGASAAATAGMAHSSLFQMISWLANSNDAKKTAESAQDAERYLASTGDVLEKLVASFVLDDDEKSTVAEARAALKDYADAAKTVIEIAAVDTATALIFMSDADQKFAKLDGRLEALHDLEKRRGDETAEAATTAVVRITRMFFALLVCAVGLAGLVTVLVSRMIARPIVGMTSVMTTLSSGDTKVAVPETEREDEIGRMAKAVLVFKENMIRADAMAAEQESQRRDKEERSRRLEKSAASFNENVGGVVRAVSAATMQLQSSAHSMSETADRASRRAAAVATASGDATINVQTVASAAEELSASITVIALHVTQSSRIARQAVDEADRTNTVIEGLAEAAQRIGDVVKLINGIAGQTNLLALNATIEAARAGDAGKGFAVVATEVKSLAMQTAKATDDIASQVAAIQAATTKAVAAIKGIGVTIRSISEIATSISAAVEEQGVATQDIARNVQQASEGTSKVSGNIAGVSEAAGETGHAADQVLSAAREMAQQTDSLRLEVNRFLAEVKAA